MTNMKAGNTAHELTNAEIRQLQNLKNSFPFRIIYGAFNPVTGEWLASAVPNMRIPNKLVREGWQVFTLKASKARLQGAGYGLFD